MFNFKKLALLCGATIFCSNLVLAETVDTKTFREKCAAAGAYVNAQAKATKDHVIGHWKRYSALTAAVIIAVLLAKRGKGSSSSGPGAGSTEVIISLKLPASALLPGSTVATPATPDAARAAEEARAEASAKAEEASARMARAEEAVRARAEEAAAEARAEEAVRQAEPSDVPVVEAPQLSESSPATTTLVDPVASSSGNPEQGCPSGRSKNQKRRNAAAAQAKNDALARSFSFPVSQFPSSNLGQTRRR